MSTPYGLYLPPSITMAGITMPLDISSNNKLISMPLKKAFLVQASSVNNFYDTFRLHTELMQWNYRDDEEVHRYIILAAKISTFNYVKTNSFVLGFSDEHPECQPAPPRNFYTISVNTALEFMPNVDTALGIYTYEFPVGCLVTPSQFFDDSYLCLQGSMDGNYFSVTLMCTRVS